MLANTGIGSRARKRHGKISKCFTLDYNELWEDQRLNATQTGLQHVNHNAEEQKYFELVLDNLSLADFSAKYVVTRLIASNNNSTEYNKSQTAQLITQATTIKSLIQHGTVNMVHTIQEKV